MGIPLFFNWLLRKKIKNFVFRLIEGGNDLTQANPNGKEFDNLYIDVNALIHNAFSETVEETVKKVCDEIEKLA